MLGWQTVHCTDNATVATDHHGQLRWATHWSKVPGCCILQDHDHHVGALKSGTLPTGQTTSYGTKKRLATDWTFRESTGLVVTDNSPDVVLKLHL